MFQKGVTFLRKAVKSAKNTGFFYQQGIAISFSGKR
jgi:hypothetical protein